MRRSTVFLRRCFKPCFGLTSIHPDLKSMPREARQLHRHTTPTAPSTVRFPRPKPALLFLPAAPDPQGPAEWRSQNFFTQLLGQA